MVRRVGDTSGPVPTPPSSPGMSEGSKKTKSTAMNAFNQTIGPNMQQQPLSHDYTLNGRDDSAERFASRYFD